MPILPQIVEMAEAGHSIPIDITPVTAMSQINTTNTTQQPINIINTGGGLKGNPPAIFNGDRRKSKGFLLAFYLYKGLNRKNESMSNPYNCVITALTFMEGDAIDSWKADQLDKLNNCIDNGYLELEEIHWREFEVAFKDAFTNTNEKAEAYQELTCLKQGDSLDIFITEFKHLVGIAKVDKDSHGVIELFKGGPKSGLARAIITSQGFDSLNPWPTLAEWIKAAHEQHIKWKMVQQFSQQKDQRRQGLYKLLE